MAALLPVMLGRQERTQQPTRVAGVNWANPLARGLKIAVVPAAGARNLALGNGSAPTPVDEVWAARLRALKWSDATSNVFDTGYKNSAITAYSMLALVNNPGITGNIGYLVSNRQAGGNAGVAVYGGGGGSAPTQTTALNVVHGGVALYAQSSLTVAGRVNTGYVALGLSATVGAQLRYCIDGKFDSPVTIGSMNSSNDNLCIGQDLLNPVSNGDYNLAAFFWWNRDISNAEMLSAQSNPSQLLASEQRPRLISLPIGPFVYARPTADVADGLWTPS